VASTTRAGYFPGTTAIRTKFVVEQASGRLLGAQIVGGDGAAKRIDAVAIAVWHAMTVDEMTGLDLAYAPPFAPVWDPVLIAARKAADAVAAFGSPVAPASAVVAAASGTPDARAGSGATDQPG